MRVMLAVVSAPELCHNYETTGGARALGEQEQVRRAGARHRDTALRL